ncbi:MAG: PilZ domain-containing protein [Gammaproteobacteria bacterium]
MLKNKENRAAVRFSTLCTVELENSLGVTRDLSTTGFCFTTTEAIQIKSMLRCVVLMPKKNGRIVRLRCEGQVVRRNRIEDGWNIAVNFTSFEW